ncbi:Octopine catabolism/uptake operon regulatory protein OccR [Pseudomonas fluorescens]|uniref:LysR substrate-binding domain-containing protein n=1 Tax=Pseudomonas fluorescens TaxID=294 RepID=UPI001254C4FF|nr:LysR substrate-binding domain-containing protein [Pseudomonas fluorescens]CAG8863376.1 Octopine catabolism/uptake operon regulatory protein OccR [Pseudomonas fluorescens]VVQ01962.1 Octopine catabolism/uptake operon regulatory protein OccR [Pseudomonas fluorescens]
MNLRQIEAFRSVMRLGSMTAAAEVLYTSQPNVSRLIAQLELSTGLVLFKRAGVRLIPTQQGQALFQEVERAYVGLDSLKHSAKNIRNLGTGRLRVAAVPSTGMSVLPRVLKAFTETRPELTVSLHVNSSSTVEQWVKSQYCDIGIVVHPGDVTGQQVELLAQTAAVCVLPCAHPLAERAQITLEDLQGQRFVSLCHGDGTRSLVDDLFEQAGVERVMAVEAQYSAINCEMVALGMGITLAHPLVARDYAHRDIVIRPFKPEILFPTYVIWPTAQARTRLTEEFVDTLKAYYKDLSEASSL